MIASGNKLLTFLKTLVLLQTVLFSITSTCALILRRSNNEVITEVKGVRTGHGFGVVCRLATSSTALPCRWAARGECEGGNQEEEKFCMVHFAYDFIIWGQCQHDG